MRTYKALLIGMLSLTACASENGSTMPVASDDAGTSDSGPIGTSDGGACVAHGNADEPDDSGTDDNCDGADGVIGVDVYVTPLGTDTNAGTPSEPLRTIAAGIKLAMNRGGKALIGSGNYSVDALSFAGKWMVVGGYGSSFVGAPKRAATMLTGPATGLLVDTAAEVRLSHLTISGAAPSDDAQLSSIALVTKATKLVLDDVELDATDARDGAVGKTGNQGAPGAPGGNPSVQTQLRCGGITQPAFSFGATSYASNAEGKRSGTFAPPTATPAGSDGAAGTDGTDADGAPKLDAGVLVLDKGTDGAANGRPGFGGPGGGGGTTDGVYYSGGAGGSGGCPGTGGGGGSTGGVSIALLVLDGNVSITRSRFHTGLGGAGGDGGDGGGGGAGGLPGLPGVSQAIMLPPTCTPIGDPARANCAEYGGAGGIGGQGGHGGGGAGGWTLGVVTAAGASAQVDPLSMFDLGRAGSGGVGAGAGRAPDGRSERTHAIP